VATTSRGDPRADGSPLPTRVYVNGPRGDWRKAATLSFELAMGGLRRRLLRHDGRRRTDDVVRRGCECTVAYWCPARLFLRVRCDPRCAAAPMNRRRSKVSRTELSGLTELAMYHYQENKENKNDHKQVKTALAARVHR
jgi:hypothetical protein